MASHYSDPELIADLKSSDDRRVDRALKYLYGNCRESAFQFVRLNGGTNEEAGDVLQDSVILAWEKVLKGTFEGRSKLTSFVIGIARLKWREGLRKKGRETPAADGFEDLAEDAEEEDPIYNPANVKLLVKAMNLIDEACRKVLTLFYYQKMPMSDIATEMNLKNEQGAKNKKLKCMGRLSSIFKNLSEN